MTKLRKGTELMFPTWSHKMINAHTCIGETKALHFMNKVGAANIVSVNLDKDDAIRVYKIFYVEERKNDHACDI